MKQHFIDTSGFVGYFFTDDQYHKEALVISKKLQQEHSVGITTDFVLSELLTFLRDRVGHQITLEIYETIKSATGLIIVYTSQKDFEQAIEIFKRYHDKNFSFVDCASFVIMRNYKINQAFTFDKHFEQAGFKIIK